MTPRRPRTAYAPCSFQQVITVVAAITATSARLRGGAPKTLRYAAVVVANGHNWSAKLPEYEGLDGYRGTVLHASAYKDAYFKTPEAEDPAA